MFPTHALPYSSLSYSWGGFQEGGKKKKLPFFDWSPCWVIWKQFGLLCLCYCWWIHSRCYKATSITLPSPISRRQLFQRITLCICPDILEHIPDDCGSSSTCGWDLHGVCIIADQAKHKLQNCCWKN